VAFHRHLQPQRRRVPRQNLRQLFRLHVLELARLADLLAIDNKAGELRLRNRRRNRRGRLLELAGQLTILVQFLHERGNRDFGPCRSSLLYLAGTSPPFYRIAYLLVFLVSLTLIRQGIAGLETTNGRTIWTTLH
jgi:hypothetical protein